MYFGAPLLGLALWRRQTDGPAGPAAILAICLLAVGVAAFLFISDEYLEQTYFTSFGLIAVMPFAAAGLIRFFESAYAEREVRWQALAGFGAAWVAAALLIAAAANHLWERGNFLRSDLVAYLPAALAIAALTVAAFRAAPPRRGMFAAFAVLAVLLTASLDAPLDVFPNPAKDLVNGKPLYPTSPAGLRPDEVRGMDWIRDHLPNHAVLAVSNDRTPKTVRLGPSDGDYPAFTEHRTLREQWVYTERANDIGQVDTAALRVDPFPERAALERALFERGDARAARIMARRYGVDYVVVSKKDGAVNPRVYRLGRLVYSNGAVDVIELSAPRRRESN
jgi:preprotein translocase subunit Sec61beta